MTTAQPLMPRYLWAAERQATLILADRLVEDRYHVISPQLWLDTKPQEPPSVLIPLPSQALAYAHLYPYKLHLPQIHGFCTLTRSGESIDIPLLENIPVDREGNLLPSLVEAWSKAPALNQIYWLWQIINLWAPLAGTGVLSSLVLMDNIRVDGWRIRLCELICDHTITTTSKVTLSKLGTLWLQTLPAAAPEIVEPLRTIFIKMQMEQASLRDVAASLNRILLTLAAQLPLEWKISGGTDVGATHQHNEDSYYPTPLEIAHDPTGGKIAIICDGVAGHEGGEVASQLAVKLLKIQTQTLFEDLSAGDKILTPEQICQTIAAIVRVVNNTITVQNQTQGREDRRRMGTTMVMAIQVNQQIKSKQRVGKSHEIYIAHVGDSRAYWITTDRCQLLTLDDDIATREVKQGRDVPWRSVSRPDATALTQALGMKTGEMIYPTVQRFMAIEDGILLLCSDGLSDRQVVESSWQEYADNILKSDIPLAEAVQSWLALANQSNGDDNISLLVMSCRVSPNRGSTQSSQLATIPREIDFDADDDDEEDESGSGLKFGKIFTRLLLLMTVLGLLASGAIAFSILRPNISDNPPPQIDRPK